ncbi:unnamed protein product [Paramecium sonneborni]|uniref:Transmembrane protein n=1 Tax=Paramecium sonneborni TaxID=65129 RepID=A0A8S1LTP1_9CILI|nr:unnamed protein product [Paramecium sonneborni]
MLFSEDLSDSYIRSIYTYMQTYRLSQEQKFDSYLPKSRFDVDLQWTFIIYQSNVLIIWSSLKFLYLYESLLMIQQIIVRQFIREMLYQRMIIQFNQ